MNAKETETNGTMGFAAKLLAVVKGCWDWAYNSPVAAAIAGVSIGIALAAFLNNPPFGKPRGLDALVRVPATGHSSLRSVAYIDPTQILQIVPASGGGVTILFKGGAETTLNGMTADDVHDALRQAKDKD